MTDRLVIILGFIVALGLAILGALAILGRVIPDPVTIVTTSALSGLLGLLARPAGRRRRGRAPTPTS